MPPVSPNAQFGKQSGIGLIEVMAAIIILSIGFLAAGRMQMQGMRFTQQAYVRAQASFLLRDITDRMRSNPAGVAASSYDYVDTSTVGTTKPTCASTADTACSPAEIAQNDLAEWAAYIHPPVAASNPLLPSSANIPARGTIVSQNGIYTVTVSWSESVNGNDEEQSLSFDFVP